MEVIAGHVTTLAIAEDVSGFTGSANALCAVAIATLNQHLPCQIAHRDVARSAEGGVRQRVDAAGNVLSARNAASRAGAVPVLAVAALLALVLAGTGAGKYIPCVRTPHSSGRPRGCRYKCARETGGRCGRPADQWGRHRTLLRRKLRQPDTVVSCIHPNDGMLTHTTALTLLPQDPQLLGSVERLMQLYSRSQYDRPSGHTHLPSVQETLSEGHYSQPDP